jgi:hypothetical protein
MPKSCTARAERALPDDAAFCFRWVDHVTVYRWVQRFTSLPADAARFARHSPRENVRQGQRGLALCLPRGRPARPGHRRAPVGSPRRGAARRFFARAQRTLKVTPSEVITDAAPVYPGVLDELLPAAWHHVEECENNPIEADHGQLKHRLCPLRGLPTDRTAQVVITGHASSRTCAAAITTSHSTLRRPQDSPPRSRNSPKQSDRLRPRVVASADQITQRSRPAYTG